MPRYFFHVIDGKEMLDTVGTVLAGEAEARAEAIVVSGEMLKDLGGAFWTTANGKSAPLRFRPSAPKCRHGLRLSQLTVWAMDGRGRVR